MQRIASNLFVYALAIALFAVVLKTCIYMAKSQSEIYPALIYSTGGGVYTMMVLYILHRRAGTLRATPEEKQRASEGDPEPLDIM